MVPNLKEEEPESPKTYVGEIQETRERLDTDCESAASATLAKALRHDRRQEHSAVVPLAGIRAGGTR